MTTPSRNQLINALAPFAKAALQIPIGQRDDYVCDIFVGWDHHASVTAGDIRFARQVYEAAEQRETDQRLLTLKNQRR